jgi:hypothetical protein
MACTVLQMEGSRHVVLLPPRHAFSGLYPFPCCHLYDGYSMVDMGRPDGAAWPQFAKVCVEWVGGGHVLLG